MPFAFDMGPATPETNMVIVSFRGGIADCLCGVLIVFRLTSSCLSIFGRLLSLESERTLCMQPGAANFRT